jgi:hypothetical protein
MVLCLYCGLWHSLETRLDTSPHQKPGDSHHIRPENRPDYKHWKEMVCTCVVPINRNRVAGPVVFWMGGPNDHQLRGGLVLRHYVNHRGAFHKLKIKKLKIKK